MSNFNKVGIFMKTFGQEVKDKPSFSSDKINKLRIDLIKEELDELTEDSISITVDEERSGLHREHHSFVTGMKWTMTIQDTRPLRTRSMDNS